MNSFEKKENFNVLFIGKLMSGRSTLINAMAGEVLRSCPRHDVSIFPILTGYGKNVDNVKVVRKESGGFENVSFRKFFDEYCYSLCDDFDESFVERISRISYVEFESDNKLFSDGMSITLVPDLDTSIEEAEHVFKKIDAIVFVLSATSLISADEKEYIAANFAGKNMRNVFFAVNHLDYIDVTELEKVVIPTVRYHLSDVFTDKNGVFDEELYNKRVFFINAYGAQCVRTGEPYKLVVGKKEIPVDIELEDTGIVEFETELKKFCNEKTNKDYKGETTMAFVNQETKRKLASIAANMKEYATLVDEPEKKGDLGIGMPTEAKIFRENARDVENGAFKVLVMGKFKNGKSTFINALVGKVMMAARASACTAVIATVEYGDDTGNVKVVYSDGTPSKTMSLKQFTDEFALSDEDQEYIEEGGRFDRFENISHVEMQSTDAMFSDGVKLIDSPGLEEAVSRTKATKEFIPKANAIIFTLSATSLFSAAEKEYIAANFAGKNMRNVFFVINRIDNLNEGQLESSVIPSVRYHLSDVFTDKNGVFDEELYNKRVFFTNAYGALCARTGEPYKLIVGKKEIPVDIELEDTGMPEFEVALRDFLNSSDRINATFASALQNMANTYQIATQTVADEKAVRSLDDDVRKMNAAKAGELLEEAEKQVKHIKNTVESTSGQIAKKIYLDLQSYVQNEIPREFAAIAKDEAAQVKFGMGKMVKLAGAMITRNESKINEVYDPFVQSIEGYIKTKLAEWGERVPTLIDADCQDMAKDLEEHVTDFDMKLEAATNMFAYGNTRAPETKKMGFKAGLQNALALSNWDLSLAVENTASGGMSWMDFAKRVATQMGIDLGISIIFGAPFLAVALPIEIISMIIKSKKMAKDMIINVGDTAFKALAERVNDLEVEFESNIIDQFAAKGDEIAQTALSLVEERKAKMQKILNENKMSEEEAKAEDERADKTLANMHGCIDSIYQELYGHTPTEEEFSNLSRNEKKEN